MQDISSIILEAERKRGFARGAKGSSAAGFQR